MKNQKNILLLIFGVLITIVVMYGYPKYRDYVLSKEIRKELSKGEKGFFFNTLTELSEERQKTLNGSLENNYPHIIATFQYKLKSKADFDEEDIKNIKLGTFRGGCYSFVTNAKNFMPEHKALVAKIVLEDQAKSTVIFKDKNGDELLSYIFYLKECDGFYDLFDQ